MDRSEGVKRRALGNPTGSAGCPPSHQDRSSPLRFHTDSHRFGPTGSAGQQPHRQHAGLASAVGPASGQLLCSSSRAPRFASLSEVDQRLPTSRVSRPAPSPCCLCGSRPVPNPAPGPGQRPLRQLLVGLGARAGINSGPIDPGSKECTALARPGPWLRCCFEATRLRLGLAVASFRLQRNEETPMRRLMIAGCVAAALGCSTTKDVVATPPPAAQPVVVTQPAQPSTVVVTPQAPPAKVIVVPSN